MTTADLYLRLSLDFEGATSIDRQAADCRRWCAANGLTVRKVHVDRGISGFSETAQRDGFECALAAVMDGEVSTLVVWKLDRLSRRGIGQVGQVLDQFEKVGARLVSVEDRLDTAQPQARMIIALLSEFARAESETIGLRVKSAKAAQRAAGLWLSGKPPFGYAIAPDRRLVPVEPAASMMRDVFAMIVAGHTLTTICRHLNQSGLRNSRGRLWRTSALSEAIKTPAYAGLTPNRHVTAEGRHAAGHPTVFRDEDTGQEVSCLTAGAKPIVSRTHQLAAFEALQGRLEHYGRGTVPRRPAHALLLRGLGRCASCERPLVTHNGYRCRRTDTAGDVVCTRPANAGVDAIDRRVAAAWRDLVCTGGPAAAQLRRTVAQRWAPVPRRLTGWGRLQAELDDLHVRLADADDARYVRGDLDAARHARVASTLIRRIARVQAALADTQPRINTAPLDDPGYVSELWNRSSHDERRELLRLAWSTILIAKAAKPGGHFDPGRIIYIPSSLLLPDRGAEADTTRSSRPT